MDIKAQRVSFLAYLESKMPDNEHPGLALNRIDAAWLGWLAAKQDSEKQIERGIEMKYAISKISLKTHLLPMLKTYLDSKGVEYREGRGIGQALQIKYGFDWMALFETKDKKVLTVDKRLKPLIVDFFKKLNKASELVSNEIDKVIKEQKPIISIVSESRMDIVTPTTNKRLIKLTPLPIERSKIDRLIVSGFIICLAIGLFVGYGIKVQCAGTGLNFVKCSK